MGQTEDINEFLAHIVNGASAAFAALFLLSSGLHAWQSKKLQNWQLTWPMPCACVLVAAGFIAREIAAQQHKGDNLASVVQGLFYAAVPTFTLPLYLLLLRLLSIRPNTGWTHPSFLFLILAAFSSAIITCTAQGCATYFNPNAKPGAISSGLALIKASLILQLFLNIVSLGFLMLWRGHQYINRGMIVAMSFFVLIILITVRNIFRTTQIFVPPLSPIWTQEVYFWVFDAGVLLIYTLLFHVLHSTIYVGIDNEIRTG